MNKINNIIEQSGIDKINDLHPDEDRHAALALLSELLAKSDLSIADKTATRSKVLDLLTYQMFDPASIERELDTYLGVLINPEEFSATVEGAGDKPIICVDIELERKYLSTVLSGAEIKRANRLDPQDLFFEPHALLLDAYGDLEVRHGKVGHDMLVDHLKSRGMTEELAAFGKATELLPMLDTQSIESATARLNKLSQSRKILSWVQKTKDYLAKGNLELGWDSLKSASEIMQRDRTSCVVEPLKESMRYAYVELVSGRTKHWVRIGVADLDREIGRLPSGSMTVIGADTHVGKSMLALMLARSMARLGHRPGIVSIEDGRDVYGSRALAAEANMKISYASESSVLGCDGLAETRLMALKSIDAAPDVIMAYVINGTEDQAVGAAEDLIRDEKCDIIFIDYLQDIEINPNVRRYDKAIAAIAKRVKRVCSRAEVPLVVLSQLKRRENKEPTMFDLKESGDIENVSDVIMLMWRDKGVTRLKIEKIKWGQPGYRGIVDRSQYSGMISGLTREEKENVGKGNDYRNWNDAD